MEKTELLEKKLYEAIKDDAEYNVVITHNGNPYHLLWGNDPEDGFDRLNVLSKKNDEYEWEGFIVEMSDWHLKNNSHGISIEDIEF